MQMCNGDSSTDYDFEVGLVNQAAKADVMDRIFYGMKGDQAE